MRGEGWWVLSRSHLTGPFCLCKGSWMLENTVDYYKLNHINTVSGPWYIVICLANIFPCKWANCKLRKQFAFPWWRREPILTILLSAVIYFRPSLITLTLGWLSHWPTKLITSYNIFLLSQNPEITLYRSETHVGQRVGDKGHIIQGHLLSRVSRGAPVICSMSDYLSTVKDKLKHLRCLSLKTKHNASWASLDFF